VGRIAHAVEPCRDGRRRVKAEVARSEDERPLHARRRVAHVPGAHLAGVGDADGRPVELPEDPLDPRVIRLIPLPQHHRLRHMGLGAVLAVHSRHVDVDLEVLRPVLGGEALAMKDQAAGVAFGELHVRDRAGRDDLEFVTRVAQELHDRPGSLSRSSERDGHVRLVHRPLDRIAHDGEIGRPEPPGERWNAPREAKGNESARSPLALDCHRPVALPYVVDPVDGQQHELPRALHLRVTDGGRPVRRHEVDRLAPPEGEGRVRRRQRTGVCARLPDDGSVGAAPACRDDELLAFHAPDSKEDERGTPGVDGLEEIKGATRAEPSQGPRLPGAARVDPDHRPAPVHSAERVP
jgi:hypothetical protein